MKKIVFVCPDGFSILLFCKGILKALKTSDKEVEVSVVIGDGGYVSEIEELGVEVVIIPMYRFFSPIRDFQTTWNLYNLFRNEKFDVVINFSTKPNILGSIASWLVSSPLRIFHIVGMGSVFLPQTTIRGKLIRVVFLFLYRFACRVTHKVWFTNKNDLEYFLDGGLLSKNKTVLTRNYLDTDYYSEIPEDDPDLVELRKELGIKGDEKVILMVARMIWAKGIKEFAEAAIYLSNLYPKLRFILVAPLETGSSDEVPESYVRGIEKLGNFRWFDFREDVVKFYGIADIAVLPTYYKEGGYPRALLEPMSMGKPIIASESVDCRGTVDHGKNGYLVPIKDSMALAESIEKIINDKDILSKFSLNSRKKAVAEFEESVIVARALEELGVVHKIA